MYKYEELLREMRRTGETVSEQEIQEAIGGLRSRIDGLICKLDSLENWTEKKRIMDELISLADLMDDMDSLNKARILYDLELQHHKSYEIVMDLFKRPT